MLKEKKLPVNLHTGSTNRDTFASFHRLKKLS
jgi:hypothetical protein